MKPSSVRRASRPARACLLAVLWSASAARAATTACTSSEDLVFQCEAGRKVIAVCASRGPAGVLQYRFGPSSAPELVLSTAATDDTKATVSGNDLAFSGGGGAYLRFHGHATDYVVYTAISSQWGEQSGVVPERDGKQLRGAKCVGKVKSKIGPAFFDEARISRDPSSFTLPD